MTLSTPLLARERILLMGGYEAGKTKAWCEIARMLHSTGSPARVFVADTDRSWERMSITYGALPNLTVKDAFDFDETDRVLKGFSSSKPTRDDWLVIDMITKLWAYSQAGFSEKAFGKQIDEWFVEAKRAGEGIGGDYGSNWGVINRMYDRLFTYIMRWPGHVLACTPVAEVREPDRSGKGGDEPEIRNVFGRFGVKPEGQKSLGHQFHTILLMVNASTARENKWTMTTVKDRERGKVAGKVVKGFVLDYLVGVAGWQL